MNTTTKFKTSFIFDDIKSKNKKNLSKSSSMICNNYSLYEKYIKKTPFNKNKSRNNENSIKSISLSSKKFGNYQSSFNLSYYDNNENKIINNNFSPFSKIMENYIQQKQKEMSLRKQNVQTRNNLSRNNKKFVLEINSNNSNSNSYNKKTYAGINLLSQHLNQLSKRKLEFKNNNKLKSTRNRNLSMKDIDNISYMINLKYTNNNNKNNKTQKDNIYVNKFSSNKKKTQTSPSYNINDKNKKEKLNTLKKNNQNNSNKIDNELEKKNNILFNSNSNYSSENNKISTSSRTNSIKGPNYNSYRSVDSENTKQNSLNIKKDKKNDNLEGPELIHFSLVELIQKGRKRMEEIAGKIKYNKKKK